MGVRRYGVSLRLFVWLFTDSWVRKQNSDVKESISYFLLIKNPLDYPFFSHQRMGSEKKFIKICIYFYVFSGPILDGAFFTATMNDNQKVMRVHVGEDKSFDFFISHWLMSEKTEFWRQGIYIMFVCLSKIIWITHSLVFYISFSLAHPWWRIFHCRHERQSKSDACPRKWG